MLGSAGRAGIAGLMCLHVEYPIGGAESGARRLSRDKKQAIDAMRKDLQFLRKSLAY